MSLALRLRRATDDERRQLLWIASSAVFLAFGVVVVLLVPRLQGEAGTWLAALPLRLAQLAVPLCVAVAVLRHRLLEIDLIVNRALVFTLATGLVAVGYVFVVVIVGLVVGGATGGLWPSLLATALVALAFQPLRRRVVRVADRLAFGAAAVPYEALADFSRRLGDSPDPADLLPAVADAAAQAVGASRVIVLLNVKAGPDRIASWPPFGAAGSTASGVTIPVVDRGEKLGSITVEMPAGHALRAREQRLLADLADQAGMAFRSVRLTAELSGEVEQLGHRTDELAESRRRLITAGDAERSRLERAIAEQVITHVAPLPNRLRQLSNLDAHATTTVDAATACAAGGVAEHRPGSAAGDHPRSLPGPAHPLRPPHRARLSPRSSQEYRPAGDRRLRSRSALRPAGGGCGVLLCGGGDPQFGGPRRGRAVCAR